MKNQRLNLSSQEDGGPRRDGEPGGSSFAILLGRREWQPRGLTAKERKVNQPNLEQLKNVATANVVHVHHQKCRVQGGLDVGLYFELRCTEGHARLADISQQPGGRRLQNQAACSSNSTHVISHHQRGCCQEITQTPNKKQAKRKQRDKTPSLLFMGR